MHHHNESPLWLFGYGSLIWRPGFRYEKRVRGFVSGFARRFWQASTDHRGVPEHPGRVATLVPEDGSECWGVAYLVSKQDRARVLRELDVRECGGYSLRELPFTARDRRHTGLLSPLVYIAEPGNPNYAGEAPLPEIAARVIAASGPSGHNVEYVLRLAESLMELDVTDRHVFDLANLVSDPDGVLSD